MAKTSRSARQQLADKVATLRQAQNSAYWAGRTAQTAYATHRENAIELARLILETLSEPSDALTWAVVGDMAAIARDLQEIAERMEA